MTVVLPENELESLNLTPEEARIELAVGLYAGKRVSLGRAARIAGVSRTQFLHEIGRRGLCVNYSVEDAEHDMEMFDLAL